MDVFVLHHVHELDDDNEDVKLIGVYSSRAAAQGAIERMSLQPGFRETVNGFTVDRYPVDKDHWAEGFVTLWPGEE